jgi:hypothetical protein
MKSCKYLLPILVLLALPGLSQAASQIIYDDDLATGWSDWSWASVDLAATSPVYSGSHSIAVTYTAGWQGLSLYYPGLVTTGFTHLRFFIHGGGAGGQVLRVYAIRASDSAGSHGPEVAVSPPAANSWTEVQIPLTDLGAANTTIVRLVWLDYSGGAQPTFYIDDISLVSDQHPDGPVLGDSKLLRGVVPADGSSGVVVRVQVSDPQGSADIASVTLDADALGSGTVVLRDDGRSNDGAAADGLFGAMFTVAPGTAPGEYPLIVIAQDQAGHRASLQVGRFGVLGSPGGSIPTGFPQRPAWGTNEWDMDPANDWQVLSGVPWEFVYQYINYDWYTDGWGGNFVGRFVNQAWDKGFIPIISVYMILGLEPGCNDETPTCYATKLQNPTAVSNYLAALEEAAQQAQGSQPVIFHLEPDFYAHMQRNNYIEGVPQPDSPANYPVALNTSGYANDLTGFGRRMVDLIHNTAPNALVAPHASMWATRQHPNRVPPDQVAVLAQSTAAFMNAMGGEQADLFIVEWSDRDAGWGDPERPWWDDTNLTLPNVNRAVLWENALSRAAGKRLVLWQVPVGNMSLDNTCERYQDNRVAYAFSHSRDLYEAGVLAVLFGPGTGRQCDCSSTDCMTKPTTDGGFLQAQGQIAYTAPITPTGLSAGTAAGPLVPLRWDENSEPDVWGYRVRYMPVNGGSAHSLDVGAANSTMLLIPNAGQWQISVAAYDARSQLGPYSTPITITTTVDADKVYLPVILKH